MSRVSPLLQQLRKGDKKLIIKDYIEGDDESDVETVMNGLEF